MAYACPLGRRLMLAGSCISLAVSWSASASAQDAGTAGTVTSSPAGADEPTAQVGVEDIIVTAERRSARIQETPLAISAVGGDTLQKQQITGLEGLTDQLPNISFSRNGGDAKIFIRGIGLDVIAPGADPRVALYTDGIYNARTQAVLGAFYDVERVEVLRGPQGTLYGRNATAGAVNILSRDPTSSLEGYGTLTVGNYDLIRTEGAVSGPLSDKISARIAFQTADRDGFGRNIQTGGDVDDEHSRAIRAKLRFEPSEKTTVAVAADYLRQDDHNGGFHFLGNTPGHTAFGLTRGFTVPENPRDYAGYGPDRLVESYGGSVTAIFDMGGPELTSVTGYRHLLSNVATSTDPTTSGFAPVTYREKSDSFTQEIRIAHSAGPVDFIIGGYFFHEKNEASTVAQLSGGYFGLSDALREGARYGGSQTTNAWAAFGQATINLSERLGIDLGLRYSYEDRHTDEYNQLDLVRIYDPNNPPFAPGFVRFARQHASWSSLDPKVTLHYKLSDDVMTYATYSQGFKSGGFNIGFLQPAFDPEEITDYEVGIKADLFDRRLRANVSGFYYDYKQLQVNVVEGLQLVTRNAAKAKIYGVEAEVTALPTDNLKIDLNFAWLHAEFTDYETVDAGRPELGLLDLKGNRLSYAPKYKVGGAIGYSLQTSIGEFTPRVNVAWTSRVDFSQFNLPYVGQKARTEIDLFLDYDAGNGWAANLFVRNLSNDRYNVSGTVASGFLGYPVLGQPGVPRTYGLAVTRRF